MSHMSAGLIIALVVIAIVIILAIWLISTYNSLVGLRNRVGNGWSQVDVCLKQRADLIPNLVSTVQGYAKHESSVFEEVARARAGVAQASEPGVSVEQRAAAENALSRALLKLNAVAEGYPDLKASSNFMHLQHQLSSLEEKIAYARQFYNDVVLKYNNKIQMFPSNLVAGMFSFHLAQFFTADEQDRQVPQVQF